METRSLVGDADGVELNGLVWRATGCVEGPSPLEGLTRVAEQAVRGLGTPALLRGLWGGAQAEVARDGGPQLHGREIGAVHEALVGVWRRLRDGPGSGCASCDAAWVSRAGAPPQSHKAQSPGPPAPELGAISPR